MSNVVIIAYDISNNKTRTKFSKFLEKHGVRIQFSVFEIRNSARVINIIKNEIKRTYSKMFEPGDSIIIFSANGESTERYGSADLLNKDIIIF